MAFSQTSQEEVRLQDLQFELQAVQTELQIMQTELRSVQAVLVQIAQLAQQGVDELYWRRAGRQGRQALAGSCWAWLLWLTGRR